jgi:hypothetical protein
LESMAQHVLRNVHHETFERGPSLASSRSPESQCC